MNNIYELEKVSGKIWTTASKIKDGTYASRVLSERERVALYEIVRGCKIIIEKEDYIKNLRG
tara:strand:- start:13411 stop:13596 length:186 start_codon:yes stop_codon:yes gene_type:complete